ncbi:MAG: excinuclease ABC subunit UvrC [Gammaproteobacteria bacterium]|nr:excinuclease ABC subunit UvrC [Gammaproteobacteria bacterium]MBU1556764.1 excinuclease ABC subunit UvrC [Gammaproteobacteria bacterium]MBU2069260.1 excinuclease ABC subunit UvrC [Gammaproteobacteria bacterium]MBU2182157.1 excinuclease ABC subunit UvrC [Gammaproteobacteria bacterium]MBU2206625.1 excinuclease ABC subunit UvrC [Gammaproteobacteria bacterium]
MFDAKAFLQSVPRQPGVYRMLSSAEQIIYVGKAKDLRARLSSYFRSQLDSIKTRSLVSQIANVEYTLTHSETEALILENNLIKQFMPRYNVLLRDDKSYPYILLTEHKHPRISSHRGPRNKAGQYFGPYPNAGAVWHSLKTLQKIFPIRQCEDGFYRARTRPCLQYQLKLCSAPCVGKISDDDYQQLVRMAALFLRGKNQQVIDDLVQSMTKASEQLQFELAAQYRDKILALRKVQEQQSVSGEHDEMDVIGFTYSHGVAAVHVLFVRQQKVMGSKAYFPKVPADTDESEILSAFLLQFYLDGYGAQQLPREIVIAQPLGEMETLAAAISEVAGRKVRITYAQRGEKAQYLSLAQKNAVQACDNKQSLAQKMALRYQQLQQLLQLDDSICRMECFDISHTMGQATIASCVVFDGSGPNKADYRRYNVTGITGGDDYAAMQFALQKRYGKLQDSDRIPDIIFIDGGQGQLNIAIDQFSNWPHAKMPLLVGVAKGTSRKPGLETLILAQTGRSINLAEDAPALHLIQQIRDEAHRFAITGHRNKRGKALVKSPLEQVKGIGEKRRQALLHYLGGLQGVMQASVTELASVPGISKAQAENIYHACHNK